MQFELELFQICFHYRPLLETGYKIHYSLIGQFRKIILVLTLAGWRNAVKVLGSLMKSTETLGWAFKVDFSGENSSLKGN